MYKKRLFLMLIAIAIVIVAAFTVRGTVAEANSFSEKEATVGAKAECASLPSRHSIHTEYEEDRGMWVTYTEDGPTGVDGGLIHLMSAYRMCSE